MPFETPLPPLKERAAHLNRRYRHHAAGPVLRAALADPLLGRMALVSSFGAESVVLLHMISRLQPTLPVLFIDTQMLFAETLEYQRNLCAKLGLRDVRVIRPDPAELQKQDPFGRLHMTLPDACCGLRKTAPLAQALSCLACLP